ncbi:hypothetical protein [Paenibacillus thermotolerans]|uniref:hypothetical protein n=1 Tax=Paenibacillus thermotolerans TaxID=3027807 RepID=UPI002367E78F|nr:MULTISPECIES: hypothetical protein [unclassified Paenibacillus]
MPSLHLSSRYAGGNIRLIRIEDRTRVVRLEQDLRDTPNGWFYWSFCACFDTESSASSAPCTYTFEFMNGEVVGPWGPAVSKDGVRWEWLGTEYTMSRTAFRYTFEAGESVYFCFCMPYQLHHFERFYAEIAPHPLVRREVLVLTEQLRPVPLLRIGNPSADRHILLTCRHHACESTPSYLLEGLITHCITKLKASFLRHILIHYIPFVDLDGVENGDQGKGRVPHDHNRDYIKEPLYRTTAAIMDYAGKLKPEAGIDFHSPYKWGDRNDAPFIVKRGSPMKEENERFGAMLAAAGHRTEGSEGRIRYDPVHDIEMGEDWNTPHGTNCSAFFERLGARLALTLEFPYFGSEGTVFTQQSCRAFGADVAEALQAYLLER